MINRRTHRLPHAANSALDEFAWETPAKSAELFEHRDSVERGDQDEGGAGGVGRFVRREKANQFGTQGDEGGLRMGGGKLVETEFGVGGELEQHGR